MNIYLCSDILSLFFKKTFGSALLATLVTITPLYAMQTQQPNTAQALEPDKPYVCTYPDCTRAFGALRALVIHERIHTGERPHICKYCNKGFAQIGDLNSHMRTHTGEKPYPCTYEGCTKKFAKSCSLLDHVRRNHTHEKFYGCDHKQCTYTCVRLSELRLHKEKKHHVTNGTFRRLQQHNTPAQEHELAPYTYTAASRSAWLPKNTLLPATIDPYCTDKQCVPNDRTAMAFSYSPMHDEQMTPPPYDDKCDEYFSVNQFEQDDTELLNTLFGQPLPTMGNFYETY